LCFAGEGEKPFRFAFQNAPQPGAGGIPGAYFRKNTGQISVHRTAGAKGRSAQSLHAGITLMRCAGALLHRNKQRLPFSCAFLPFRFGFRRGVFLILSGKKRYLVAGEQPHQNNQIC
jgi:hypothetical protein